MDDLPPVAISAPSPPQLILSPTTAMDAAAFQQQWAALPTADAWTGVCSDAAIVSQLSARLGARHVKCMAFGTVGDQTKFYFYAEEVQARAFLLVELVISTSTAAASATVKSSAPGPVQAFSECLKRELGCR